jgi:two-component system, OmpR family, KDP operon response regulator KdpE
MAISKETTILVIEDEAPIRRFLRASLESQGLKMLEAAAGQEGLLLATSYKPDVLLLDLGLPDIDGLEIIRRIRDWSTMPIIILSARGKDADKIAALDAGADDYLTKPFSTGELMARIRVALRHTTKTQKSVEQPVFQAGDLRVDFTKRQVYVREAEVHLTPIEYNLLAVLVRYAGRVVTHRQLLKEVWDAHSTEQSHYLRIYMHQLRRKLESDPAKPEFLLTEPGVGYRLKDDS